MAAAPRARDDRGRPHRDARRRCVSGACGRTGTARSPLTPPSFSFGPDACERARRIAERTFPERRVARVEPLLGGRSNACVRVAFADGGGDVVVRRFTRDPSAARRELDALTRARERVPVPNVLAVDLAGDEDGVPHLVLQYVSGVTFRTVRRDGNASDAAEAGHAVGATLARIGAISFAGGERFRAAAGVFAERRCAAGAFARFVRACVASPAFAARVDPATARRLVSVVDPWSARLDVVAGGTQLAHGDFSRTNVIVRREAGTWLVAAVVDWEFACAATPALDLAHALRYERLDRDAEPAVVRGFVAGGGALPRDWRRFVRIVDLAALAGALTKPGLPVDAAGELRALLHATVHGREDTA